MSNAFDDIQPDSPPNTGPAPKITANAFDDITPPPKQEAARPPVTAGDRVEAAEGGFLKGAAYLATLPADAVANIYNLGKAGVGYGYSKLTGNAVPHALEASDASPVGGWLTRQMDKNSITSTQPNRPDDAASRYLATAGSVIPGILTGGEGLGSTLKSAGTAIPPALAGHAISEAHPFQSDWANNLASIGTQAAGMAMMPRGTGADVAGNEVRNQTIRNAQGAGMVFPPATTNPSGPNRALEGVAGKQQVQQHATLTNRDAVNAAARADLGIGGHGGISDSELATVKSSARPAYDAVRSAGHIATGSDAAFVQNVNGALSKFTGASNVLSNAGDNGLRQDVTDILAKPSADAGHLVDTIGILRDRSKTAFRQGDAGIGAAYSQVSNALENQIQAQLPPGSPILQNYQAARKQLAVAHSVEDARNEGSGDVNAQKLASQLGHSVPLSGNLLIAAKAASLVPKAFAPVTDSKGVNHLGLWGGIAGAAITAHEIAPDSHLGIAAPAAAGAWHGGRIGARMYALGPGQSNAIAKQRLPIDKNALIGSYLATQGKTQ